MARFGSVLAVGPRCRWPVAEGLGGVSPLFFWVFASAVLEGDLPTLKTGNGESRSWVRIPPHPLGFPEASQLSRFSHPGRVRRGVCDFRLGQGLGSCRTRGCLPGSDPTLNPHIAWYKKPKPVTGPGDPASSGASLKPPQPYAIRNFRYWLFNFSDRSHSTLEVLASRQHPCGSHHADESDARRTP